MRLYFVQKKKNCFFHFQIMPQNKYQELIINYEYNVKNDDFTFEKNKYEWVFDHWTDCSVTCGKGNYKGFSLFGWVFFLMGLFLF